MENNYTFYFRDVMEHNLRGVSTNRYFYAVHNTLPHSADKKVITVKQFGDYTKVGLFYDSYKSVQESTPIEWDNIATEIQIKFINLLK